MGVSVTLRVLPLGSETRSSSGQRKISLSCATKRIHILSIFFTLLLSIFILSTFCDIKNPTKVSTEYQKGPRNGKNCFNKI